nr:hypothetical protein Iba_chr06cCG6840 [Ipomoea batatas]
MEISYQIGTGNPYERDKEAAEDARDSGERGGEGDGLGGVERGDGEDDGGGGEEREGEEEEEVAELEEEELGPLVGVVGVRVFAELNEDWMRIAAPPAADPSMKLGSRFKAVRVGGEKRSIV